MAAAQPPAGKTPRIQLVLNLDGGQPAKRVKRVTKGHEVVEVNGFTFKRRREAPPTEKQGPNAAAASHLLKTPHVAAAAGSARGTPLAEQHEVSRELYLRLTEASQALPEHASPAERLRAYCGSLCSAALDRTGGEGELASALAEVFALFQLRLDSALQRGSVRLAAPGAATAPSPAGEVSQGQAHYGVDLEARKAGLRARQANFQLEEAEWQALLLKAEQVDAHLAAEAGAAAAEGGDASVVGLAKEQAELPDALAALERTQQDLHRHLTMQVDGLCKLVGDVEELVDSANRSAHATQAEFHKDKFQVFPHVDSPARLIKELVKPAPRVPRQQQEDGGVVQT